MVGSRGPGVWRGRDVCILGISDVGGMHSGCSVRYEQLGIQAAEFGGCFIAAVLAYKIPDTRHCCGQRYKDQTVVKTSPIWNGTHCSVKTVSAVSRLWVIHSAFEWPTMKYNRRMRHRVWCLTVCVCVCMCIYVVF